MIPIISFLVFLVLHGAYAQDCVPEPPKNVTLDTDYLLRWEASTNCPNTLYMIYIHVDIDDLQYIYTANALQLYVIQLPACDRFYFEVRAFVGNDLSDPATLVAYVPAPSGADLTIEEFTASVQEQATFLNWHVTEKFAHCARGFRLVIHDTVTPIPRDVYTERNNIFLNDLVPCGVYQFAIMAIYNLQSEGPISLINYTVHQEIAPLPVLQSVDPGTTHVNLTWGLPPYSVNRCSITSLEINALPTYYEIYPYNDSPSRPPFTTTVNSLRPDNLYVLKVSLENSAGSTEPFSVAVQTLPARSG